MNLETSYQLDNLPILIGMGSASLELNDDGGGISYEEYHPFGTTSYRSGKSESEVSLKRYKYVGKERDEETGLYYYGARYYSAWLGRFVSVDPLQHKYPYYTPYQYAGNKPITFIDLDGLEEVNVTNDEEIGSSQSIDNAYNSLKFTDIDSFNEYESYKSEVQTRLDKELNGKQSSINKLKIRIDNLDKTKKRYTRKKQRLENRLAKIQNTVGTYEGIMNELHSIENSDDFTFRFSLRDGGIPKKAGGVTDYNINSGEIDVIIKPEYSGSNRLQRIAHELTHATQLINGKLGDGKGLPTYSYDLNDELEAFSRQNLFANTEGGVGINNIYNEVKNAYPKLVEYSVNRTVQDFFSNNPEKHEQIIGSNALRVKGGKHPYYIYSGWKNDMKKFNK